MQTFFKTHQYLLRHLEVPVSRHLMTEVDWDHRLIGILGSRGVGKTTFLLDYARSAYGFDKSCLYVNLNNFYFAGRSLVEFADEFRKTGGRVLLLDQVYKYPRWKEDLKYCYDNFTDLKVIASGSPLMHAAEENPGLKASMVFYNIEGFTFREYLNLKTEQHFEPCSLDELLNNHENIASDIIAKVKPLAYFSDYLHHGYYPFFLEKSNFLENLIKTINLVLEIDISYLQQIELKYLPKLRKLLYLVGKSAPLQPNISRLSSEVETSRATIMNYLNYLSKGKLINLLYQEEMDNFKKPSNIYLQNPNLVYSMTHGEVEMELLHKTFFYNQVGYLYKLNHCNDADFCVNNSLRFHVGGRRLDDKEGKGDKDFYARDMVEIGKGRYIPLWLFGFLY